jgi:hypothetical protein
MHSSSVSLGLATTTPSFLSKYGVLGNYVDSGSTTRRSDDRAVGRMGYPAMWWVATALMGARVPFHTNPATYFRRILPAGKGKNRNFSKCRFEGVRLMQRLE